MHGPLRRLAPALALALLAWAAPVAPAAADPGATAGDAPPAGRVVLVGVDGASWSRLDPGIARGELPHFAALAARGVTARMATVEPVNSPTVWTTIATGRRPAAHGVTSFLADRHTLRVPTTWERLAARGRRVGLYDYLVTWPPRRLPGGFVVPGWLRRDDRIEPPDLFAAAGLEPYRYDMDGVHTPDQFVANSRREVAEKAPHFVRLLERARPEVAAVTFYSVDATSHRFWAHAFPDEFGPDAGVRPDPRYRGVIGETLRGVDAALGRIAAALGPDDHLIVVSDHGFRADPDGVRRVWVTRVEDGVARIGLEPGRDAFRQGGFGVVSFAVAEGPFAAREQTLERLYRLVAEAHSAAGEPLFDAYRIDVAPRPPGSERSLWERVRQWGVRAYLGWEGIDLDHPVHGYVFARPHDETLAALWPDGEVVFDGRRAPVAAWFHVEEFSGTHDPTAVFLAAGPAFAARAERGDLSVLDVSPLLFHLAGEPVPDDLEGEVPAALLSPAWRAAHPVRRIAADAIPRLPETAPRDDEGRPRGPVADDETVNERLRALGYAE